MKRLIKTNDISSLPSKDYNRVVYDASTDIVTIKHSVVTLKLRFQNNYSYYVSGTTWKDTTIAPSEDYSLVATGTSFDKDSLNWNAWTKEGNFEVLTYNGNYGDIIKFYGWGSPFNKYMTGGTYSMKPSTFAYTTEYKNYGSNVGVLYQYSSSIPQKDTTVTWYHHGVGIDLSAIKTEVPSFLIESYTNIVGAPGETVTVYAGGTYITSKPSLDVSRISSDKDYVTFGDWTPNESEKYYQLPITVTIPEEEKQLITVKLQI